MATHTSAATHMTAGANRPTNTPAVSDSPHNPRPPIILNANGSSYPPTPQNLIHNAGTMVVTNSAYGTYAVAPETIATIYGSNLAAGPVQAQVLPLPTMLGGITVNLKDATGATFAVPLIYVSPNQVNCVIPKGVAIGVATLIVSNGNATSTWTAMTGATAPGLDSANQTGQGPRPAQSTHAHTYPHP